MQFMSTHLAIPRALRENQAQLTPHGRLNLIRGGNGGWVAGEVGGAGEGKSGASVVK